MSRTLRNIKLGLDESLSEHLAWLVPDCGDFRILRQSVDARRRHSPQMVYSVEVFAKGESVTRARIEVQATSKKADRVVIVGAGPAGLFAALRLVERGIPCLLLEQGSATEKRIPAIARFWRRGELDERNNVGFGEGGAGLFSDGKLITRIKSPHIAYVMQRLVQFGAPPEIEYLSNPHVGSDRIRRVIPKLRQYLQSLGCEVRFDCKVDEILCRQKTISGVRLGKEVIACTRLILACGHSAEDMFFHLSDLGVSMEGKSFAVGLRIEHPQQVINAIQFRAHANHPRLGAAAYRLAAHEANENLGVYSFCMCPGGYVLSAGTSPEGVVCNGMSNFKRNSPFANSAVVATVDHERTFPGDVFGGLKFRQALEREAQQLVRTNNGHHELPAQRLSDFMEQKSGPVLDSSCPSGVVAARLDQLMGADFHRHFMRAMQKFDQQMKGFNSTQALLHGVESRTSCPIRIPRDAKSLQSVSHPGLYPTGEGAGYAGGITSAAVDGIRVADAIAMEIDEHLFDEISIRSNG